MSVCVCALSNQMETRLLFGVHINKDGHCGLLTKQTEQGHSNTAGRVEPLDRKLQETPSREKYSFDFSQQSE